MQVESSHPHCFKTFGGSTKLWHSRSSKTGPLPTHTHTHTHTHAQLSSKCHAPSKLEHSLFLECAFPTSLPSYHLLVFFFFWPHRVAWGLLVPRPGIEPAPPAVEAQRLNRWTAREVPLDTSESPSGVTSCQKPSLTSSLPFLSPVT